MTAWEVHLNGAERYITDDQQDAFHAAGYRKRLAPSSIADYIRDNYFDGTTKLTVTPATSAIGSRRPAWCCWRPASSICLR